jgi:hypothetical protein
MTLSIIRTLGLVVTIVLSAGSSPGGSPAAAADAPKTLGDILSTDTTGNKPPTRNFYVPLAAAPDTRLRIPENQCVDRSFWSFARKFIGITKSASAILTAKITPTTDPAQAITFPIFLTSANEVDSSEVGSICQTEFQARPVTFAFSSNLTRPSTSISLFT